MGIDHKDGDKTNNAWENLRQVTDAVNAQNQRKAKIQSKSGLLGVRINGIYFQAVIGVDGRNMYLGTFKTAKEAHERYLEVKREIHEGCTL